MEVFAPCIEYVKGLCEKAVEGSDPMPTVRVGWPTSEKNFLVYVVEDPQSVEYTDLTTSHVTAMGKAQGLYRVEFSVGVQMLATRRDAESASRLVLGWYEALVAEVARDKTLGGLCSHARPFFSSGATGVRDKQVINAIEGGVRIKADFDPTK